MFKPKEDMNKILTPKDGQSSVRPEDLASAIMMEKLNKENGELRR